MTVSRRQIVFVLAAAGGLGPLSLWLASKDRTPDVHSKVFPFQRSDDDWRAALSPDRYRILRGHSTERAFTSPLNAEKRTGTFVCAGCGNRLFSSDTKFESGTGWPSFWRPIEGAVGTEIDRSWLMVRTEVHCARCGGHLGHVFNDGPAPTGLRYCINGLALEFVTSDSSREFPCERSVLS
jgi:peptide-methionine (R)-S-oxide reductase